MWDFPSQFDFHKGISFVLQMDDSVTFQAIAIPIVPYFPVPNTGGAG